MNKQERSGKLNCRVVKTHSKGNRYHAHSEVQRADGLYGGLVVHKPSTTLENLTYQYDHELLFLVGDWYHWQAKKALGMFMRMTSAGGEVCPLRSLQGTKS